MKYIAKFLREFEVEIDTHDLKFAEAQAKRIVAALPWGSCKIVSIVPEGYVPPREEPARVLSTVEKRNEEFAKKVRAELDRPRMPGGLDDLDFKSGGPYGPDVKK